jgi:hypothetical protein
MMGRVPDETVELAMNTWSESFTQRQKLNNKPVVSQLAAQLRMIGLKFTD